MIRPYLGEKPAAGTKVPTTGGGSNLIERLLVLGPQHSLPQGEVCRGPGGIVAFAAYSGWVGLFTCGVVLRA
jgi:hypothetical protein